MPSFDSPLGTKKLPGGGMREIDVPDESEFTQHNIVNPVVRRQQNMPALNEQEIMAFQNKMQDRDLSEIERDFKEARKAKMTGKERLNEGAKRRIEMLLDMTKTTHQATINGTVFVLQTLPGKSMREAIMIASEFDGTVQSPFEIRRQLLSRSLVEIGGISFTQFVGSDDLESKMAFVDELPEPLLNRLYDEYLDMAKKAKDQYSVKNDQDAQELIENLKK